MALNHALLAALSHQSQTGYELARSFDASLGHFWQASHQQIYRELARLEADGLLSCQHVAQESRPDRKVYSLTSSGLTALSAWLGTPGKPIALKDELLIKLYAGTHTQPEVLLAELDRHRGLHARKLAEYEQIEQQYFSHSERTPSEKLIWLTLQAGLSYERGWLGWSELAHKTLTELAKTNKNPVKLDLNQAEG